jgi:hypothetical protein
MPRYYDTNVIAPRVWPWKQVFLGIGTPTTVATKNYAQPYTIDIVLNKHHYIGDPTFFFTVMKQYECLL